MFTNQDIVAVVFRLINFFALIGVGFFLFKKHIKPDLLNSIEKKKNDRDALSAQQAMLEKQQLTLDTLLKEDALMCQDFRAKIDEWKKVVAVEYERNEQERNNTLIKYNNRIAHIATQQEKVRVQNIVTHNVALNVEKSLSAHFKDPKQGAEYLDAIFHFMDKKTL